MKLLSNYFIISIIAALCGMLLVSVHNNWLMIRFPSPISQADRFISEIAVPKKNILFCYWKNNTWHHEKTSLIWHTDKATQLNYLLNSWFAFLDEEQLINKRVCVQTVLLTTADQEALISLDRSPFNKQSSTHEKLMLIEGLLKTIRDNGISLQRIRLFVHHMPLEDEHLDFMHAWPIHGFTS